MYAGTTFRCGTSGRVVGVHQKIDRIARHHLNDLIKRSDNFPGIRGILKFEGKDGPDGLKIKRARQHDVPSHFINPNNPEDKILIEHINNHIYNLAVALKNKDEIKAAFESSWLAHAVVDGLTPPHYYPYFEKVKELFGRPRSEMVGLFEKLVIKGSGGRDTIKKNWKYWGIGGVSSSHLLFELGVAFYIASEKFEDFRLPSKDISFVEKNGYEAFFIKSVQKIYDLKMYETDDIGWTNGLDSKTKKIIIPENIKNVILAWYQAVSISREM